MVKQRNLGLCIVLSIVTCGIYGLYWFYCLNEDTNKVSNEPKPTSGVVAILLTLVTCGIYGFYWMFKHGDMVDKAFSQRGQETSSRGVLYLVLSVVGLSIVSFALMQDSINKIVDIDSGSGMNA